METAYIYSAALWCESCGEAIAAELRANGAEDTGDSGDFPQSFAAGFSETDSPYHCDSGAECPEAETLSDGARFGRLIGESLTSEGYAYVREAIAEALAEAERGTARGASVALELWAEAFGFRLDCAECPREPIEAERFALDRDTCAACARCANCGGTGEAPPRSGPRGAAYGPCEDCDGTGEER